MVIKEYLIDKTKGAIWGDNGDPIFTPGDTKLCIAERKSVFGNRILYYAWLNENEETNKKFLEIAKDLMCF